MAIVPATGEFANETIQQEANQVMKNLQAILIEAGMNFTNIVKTTIFLSDMSLFVAVNEVYATYFDGGFSGKRNGGGKRPAQKCQCGNKCDCCSLEE